MINTYSHICNIGNGNTCIIDQGNESWNEYFLFVLVSCEHLIYLMGTIDNYTRHIYINCQDECIIIGNTNMIFNFVSKP